MNAEVWIVDDDASIRFVLEKALGRAGLSVRSFASTSQVRSALSSDGPPRAMVSDIRMPGGHGLDLLAHIKQHWPELPVIIMTAYSDLDSAVSSFQGGAFEYLAKPFDVEKAVEWVQRALQETAKPALADAPAPLPDMLGQAPAMQGVFRAIGRLSQSVATVLVTGESGTGKERVAQALHRHSPRASGPFVAINMAAIPRDLLESELFGHERGAFTGAAGQRRGRFEQAEGGTLFLDEIGDMPLDLQTRLLRVLSDGHFYRVGGSEPIKAKVRIVAATHQDLEQRVRDGLFREDLFHRLNVIRLRLPRLSERQEDIPVLADYFLSRSAAELGIERKQLSPPALQALLDFDFPGHVRQLENMCHWLTVMAPGQTISCEDLPIEVLQRSGTSRLSAGVLPEPAPVGVKDGAGGMGRATVDPSGAQWQGPFQREALALMEAGDGQVWDQLLGRAEQVLIDLALSRTGQRRAEAARLLGIGRNTLSRKRPEPTITDRDPA